MGFVGLATGAGAASGLEDLLTRMRIDEEFEQRKRVAAANMEHQKHADMLAGRTQDRLDRSSDIANDMAGFKRDVLRQIAGMVRVGGEGSGAGTSGSTLPAGDGESDYSNRDTFTPPPTSAREVTGGMSRIEDLNNPSGRGALQVAGLNPNEMFGPVQTAKPDKPENTTSDEEYLEAYAKKIGKKSRHDLTDNERRDAERKMAQAKHIDSPVVIQTAGGEFGKTQIVPKTAGTSYDRPAPQQVTTRADNARRVGSHMNDIMSEAATLDKAGLFGPIAGRWSDFAADKWGSANDIGQILGRPVTPQEEELISEFRADVGLLKSGMAMVHGGSRGGGSIEMNRRFDAYMNNNHMDLNHFLGASKSFQKWLSKYADLTPDDAPNTNPAAGPGDMNDLYQQYLNRNKKPGGGQ